MVMIHEVLNEGNIISYFFKKTIRAILNSHTFAQGIPRTKESYLLTWVKNTKVMCALVPGKTKV